MLKGFHDVILLPATTYIHIVQEKLVRQTLLVFLVVWPKKTQLHNASTLRLFNLVRNFVINSPAAENARSASTLVGGIVSIALIIFNILGVLSPVASNKSNYF